MRVVGIIPARYGSSRLPGKPLKNILGHPMVWWVYMRAREAGLEEVYVATDDDRIMMACEKRGMPCVMTSSHHATGAHRLQEVSEKIPADFYVQINGDEPLVDIRAIKAVIPPCVPKDVEFGTNVITEMTDPAQVLDPSNIKVAFDEKMNALYMSRSPIPYPNKSIDFKYYKHVGVIGYNKVMLDFYRDSKPGRFEKIEGIDTLRFLDYGKQLLFSVVSECRSLSVDTEKDLAEVIKSMQDGGLL